MSCPHAFPGLCYGCLEAAHDAAVNALDAMRVAERDVLGRLYKARAALERIEDMAVRPRCVCGRPTGTRAIHAVAVKALR